MWPRKISVDYRKHYRWNKSHKRIYSLTPFDIHVRQYIGATTCDGRELYGVWRALVIVYRNTDLVSSRAPNSIRQNVSTNSDVLLYTKFQKLPCVCFRFEAIQTYLNGDIKGKMALSNVGHMAGFQYVYAVPGIIIYFICTTLFTLDDCEQNASCISPWRTRLMARTEN